MSNWERFCLGHFYVNLFVENVKWIFYSRFKITNVMKKGILEFIPKIPQNVPNRNVPNWTYQCKYFKTEKIVSTINIPINKKQTISCI